MRRAVIAIFVIAVIAIGGEFIATTAYQAGLAANVTVVQAGASGAVVAPVVVPAYGVGWGWGWHGFGFFGFLGALFFLFLLFGLIRFAFGGGRRGWGGPGGWGRRPGRWTSHDHQGGSRPWEARAHQTFDDWHRTAHGDAATGSTPTSSTPTSSTTDDTATGPRA